MTPRVWLSIALWCCFSINRAEALDYPAFKELATRSIYEYASGHISFLPVSTGILDARKFGNQATAADYEEIFKGLANEQSGDNYLVVWHFLLEIGTPEAINTAKRARSRLGKHPEQMSGYWSAKAVQKVTHEALHTWRGQWMTAYPALDPDFVKKTP